MRSDLRFYTFVSSCRMENRGIEEEKGEKKKKEARRITRFFTWAAEGLGPCMKQGNTRANTDFVLFV